MDPIQLGILLEPPKEDETLPEIIPEFPTLEPDRSQLTGVEAEEFKGVLYEIHRRRNEALRIFTPLAEQERGFSNDACERLAIGGNRGGKTTWTVVEIARAVTGQDPYDKYPRTDGKCILVGRDIKHCGKVFYEKMFKPGAFKIIRDVDTGEWRTYNPNNPVDKARSNQAKKSPPLIPDRFYDYRKIVWENKKDEEPKTIPLKNGWTLYFFSSLGAPPQGWNVDIVAFDEEIEHPLWYPEMSARLLDNMTVDPETGKVRGGKFIWSATPQACTQRLYDLYMESEKVRGEESPRVLTLEFGMLDNQFVLDKAKRDFIAKFAENEDELAVRVYGKFALLGTRIYSEFMPNGVHGCDPFPIPEDWTSYMVVDPGRQVCAVLFFAVPPPWHAWAKRKIVYDELYIKRCNAKIFADAVVKKVNGRPIQAGIIDWSAGRIPEIGTGVTHEQQYAAALKAVKFKFTNGGSNFIWSSNDVKGGIERVRNAMHIVNGRTELVVMKGKTPNLCHEIERYAYKRLPSGLVTDEPIKQLDHSADCLRYGMMAEFKWARPPKRKAMAGYTTRLLEAKKERAKHRRIQDNPHGGSIKVG